jgi:hypothetical protein
MIILRAVFSLAVLALAGVLMMLLSGHLWAHYQEQTKGLGFSGISQRLVSQVGLAEAHEGGTRPNQEAAGAYSTHRGAAGAPIGVEPLAPLEE